MNVLYDFEEGKYVGNFLFQDVVTKIVMVKGDKGDVGASGDYSTLLNKPSINSITLNGNKTASDLGLATTSDIYDKMPIVTFGTPTVLVDTTTVSFSKDGDNEWYVSVENPLGGFTKSNFTYDTLYKIEWDGVEYEEYYAVAEIVNAAGTGYYDWGLIGNASIIGFNNRYQTSAPFLVEYDYYRNSAEVQIFTSSTSATHTIKITSVPFTKVLKSPVLWGETIWGANPLVRASNNGKGVEIGLDNTASGEGAFATGFLNTANGSVSYTEGVGNTASGNTSHAEGWWNTVSGVSSHVEGYRNTVTGNYSHAEGNGNTVSGTASHVEGYGNTVSGSYSHVEGIYNTATYQSHTEGAHSETSGLYSHAEGGHSVANHKFQHVFGQYNIADPSSAAANALGTYVEIVGNGTADDARSNARTLDWNGNETLAGSLTLGVGTSDEVTITPSQLKQLLALIN